MELHDEDEARPSKSARKRDAHERQSLGERLLKLKEAELAALTLPETLRDAIHEGRRITSRAAGARHRQYIGKLMRDIDPDPIRRALDALALNPLHHPRARPGKPSAG